MSGLEFQDVRVTYGSGRTAVHVVDGVCLGVPRGTIVGLVGESGSGKSTLARAAVGLAPLTAGSITLDGDQVDRGRERPVQMVFQDPVAALDPRMTVSQTLAEALSVVGRASRRDRADEVERLLDLVHLDGELSTRLPAALSGGQRQRVALARALAPRPQVVIADEITSALDVSVQGAVLNLVRELQRELGLAMLFISHNLATVHYVSDVIAVMYLGRIVEVGPAEEVVASPQHPYTKLLLGTAPQLGQRLNPHALPAAVSDAEPADPHRRPHGCPFHPRCPVGPVVDPSRTICATEDPQRDADRRVHRAACHFVKEQS